MTQPHETDAMTAFDHVNAIIEHTRPDVLTHVLVNTGEIPPSVLKRYTQGDAFPVTLDGAKIRGLGYKVIEANIVNCVETIRHNPRRVSKVIIDILNAKKKAHGPSAARQRVLYAKAV
jgi:2-phospho-L-lactate transferase/gluconeogenesis factor (CofD/UPF0052 family)